MKNVIAAVAIAAVSIAASPAFATKSAVPSYFPLWSIPQGQTVNADWKAMCDGMPDGSIAIVNPNSGPHTEQLSYILTAVEYCQSTDNGKHHDVLGYVSTAYGTRSLTAVEQDVEKYYDFYPVNGIFFDEVATGPDATASGCNSYCNTNTVKDYYAEAVAIVEGTGGGEDETLLNMGIDPATDWVFSYANAGKIVIFESNVSAFLSWTAPSWVNSYTADHFAVMAYSVPNTTTLNSAKSHATSNHIGRIYFTDQSLSENPWDGLTTYWPQ